MNNRSLSSQKILSDVGCRSVRLLPSLPIGTEPVTETLTRLGLYVGLEAERLDLANEAPVVVQPALCRLPETVNLGELWNWSKGLTDGWRLLGPRALLSLFEREGKEAFKLLPVAQFASLMNSNGGDWAHGSVVQVTDRQSAYSLFGGWTHRPLPVCEVLLGRILEGPQTVRLSRLSARCTCGPSV
jgi:hypothetical protein